MDFLWPLAPVAVDRPYADRHHLRTLVLYVIPRTSVLGAVLWGGLWLHDRRLRQVFAKTS